jgi:hypothetical protein
MIFLINGLPVTKANMNGSSRFGFLLSGLKADYLRKEIM